MTHGDFITEEEQRKIDSIFRCNRDRIVGIRNNGRCMGDQAREIMRVGITWSVVYARRLLEMAASE